jgi:hypothetical protein
MPIKKKQKDDYVLMFSALLLLVISSFVILYFPGAKKPETNLTQTPKIIGKAELVINFGDGKERNFEGEIIEGETLFDALDQASKAGNFSYKLDEKNNLAAIEDFIKNNNKSWHWYLNDKKINKPLGEIILKSSDKILIKYAQ